MLHTVLAAQIINYKISRNIEKCGVLIPTTC